MVAGRGLDERVHEQIMGKCVHEWYTRFIGEDDLFNEVRSHVCEKCYEHYESTYPSLGPQSGKCPHYSTSIAAAWEVVEKVRATVSVELEFQMFAYEDGTWQAEFGIEGDGFADTAPLVICLAALAAVGALPTEGDET